MIRLDWNYGPDSVTHQVVAPEHKGLCLGSGDDGKGNAGLRSPPASLLLTCEDQRKDSPAEAFTLSPEPLHGDGEEGKTGGNRANDRWQRGRDRETK